MSVNQTLVNKVKVLREFKNTHKLFFFRPYDYQYKFMEAGSHFKQRYLRAGNRCGKTYGAAYEFAQHLTGLYQDWFPGERIQDSGHTYWCIGVDLDAVSRVIQKELFGTSDIRMEGLIGTGAIPKYCIVTDEGMVKDGAKLRSCFIRHTDGGYNQVIFYGANNEQAMMGQAVKGAWLDEEPEHNSMRIYAQTLTRTATTDGFVMFTATPEAGMTELNKLYENDDTGELYLQAVTWDDCPHLTPEVQKRLLAGIPEWQHNVRMKGIPFMGSGAIFPYKESDICYDELDYDNPSLVINVGIDFGISNDPSVLMYCIYDKNEDIYYIDEEVFLDDSFEARAPDNIARTILEGPYPNIEAIIPHDGGMKSENPMAKAKLMEDYGFHNLNQARNPSSIIKGGKEASMTRIPGLDWMALRMREGRLKVNRKCKHFLKEMGAYYYQTLPSGSVEPKGKMGDHAIDAARYALMSLVRGIYSPLDVASQEGQSRWSSNEDIQTMYNDIPTNWSTNADYYGLNRQNSW